MNNVQKSQQYKELKQIISEKCKELKIRIERLQYNIIVGVSKNSINAQKEKYQIQNQQQIVQNIYINITYIHLNKMNKEEFIIDEKTYENHKGLK